MKAKPSKFSKVFSTFLTFFLLVQLIAGIFLFVPKPQEVKADGVSWYNSSWLYRKPVTLTNASTSTLANYQVQVSVTYDSHMQSDFDDIRFTDSDGVTPLDHWLETYTTSTSATFWAEVPSIAASSTATIYMYYGNSGVSSISNGLATFGASGFDDFELYNTGSLSSQPSAVDPWTEYSGNPVLSSTIKDGFSSVLKVGDTYHAYYSWDNVLHATSSDGKNWMVDTAHNPVLTNAGVPSVWKEGSTWYMLYRSGTPPTANLATSTDGITWTKYAGNPVLTGTPTWTAGVEPFGIIKVDSTYYMFYSDWGIPRKQGVATSTDLINWTMDVNNPIFVGGRFCGSPFKYGNYYYFLVPHYAPGTTDYSQIELYRDTSPTFYPGSREFVKVAIQFGPNGTWNDFDQDTPFVLTDDIFRNSFNASNNELWAYFAGSPDSVIWNTGMTIEADIASALEKIDESPFWTVYAAGNSTTTVVGAQTWQGAKAININDPDTSAPILYTTFDPMSSGVVGVWMKRDNTTPGGALITIYSGDTEVAVAGFYPSKFYVYHDGYFDNTTPPYYYSADTWYFITIEFDIDIGKYNFVVYDTSLVEVSRTDAINLTNSLMVDTFKITPTSAFIGNIYVDNFRLRKYTFPEPSVSLAIEEAIPTAPTIGIPSVLSSSAIRWNFTDNSSYETGSRVYTNADTIATSSATANLTYLDETGLSENTQYTGRYVKAYNTYGSSAASSTASSKYTLADTPTNLDNSATRDSISLTVDSFPNASSGSSGYYFYRTNDSSRNSGWISKNSWMDTGLTCGSKYTYGVKYRNGDSVETSALILSQNTEPCVSEGGASVDVPRPSDLPNSPELALTDADQKPTPPKASKYNPSGGFDLLLNGGAKTTPNPEIALFLFGGPDTKYMQISEDPAFKGAKQEIYTPHKHYNLKNNKLGKHTIYIRYFTLYDVSSETVSQSILLTKTTPSSSPPSQAATPSIPSCTTTIIKTGDTLCIMVLKI